MVTCVNKLLIYCVEILLSFLWQRRRTKEQVRWVVYLLRVALGHKIMEKPNILMVDDRSENLLALSSQLDDIGANIITANSGNEALILASEQSFVVILMDVQMPEMDCF